jgi:hypothetical protein
VAVTKTLPATVTYLDIMKTIAVIVMIIDHIGFYFFPDAMWFRAVGRVGTPIWFFLIGYATTRDLPNKLLIGALVLAVIDLVLFNRVFALNVLVTIMAIRLSVDYVMNFITRSRYIFFIASILMALFYVATNMVFEYGTIALMFAVLGYMVRHKNRVFDLTPLRGQDIYIFASFTFLIFCVFQNAQFHFSAMQLCVMAGLSLAMTVAMMAITPREFPRIRNKTIIQALHVGGRKTLEIYVAHLIVFKVILFASLTLN